mgnify:CR=1 FL=1
MPTVKMNKQLSGTRNGQLWAAPGESQEVTDVEAADLVSLGLAVMEGTDVDSTRQQAASADQEQESGPTDEPATAAKPEPKPKRTARKG